MKTILFLSLLIGVFIIYALGDITEVENNCHCGAHDRCCHDAQLGPVCYNPNTHTCADNRKLCGKNDGVCGNQCYNRKTHRCLTSAHGCKLCSVYDSLCGTTCYNPNLYRCSSGSIVPLSRVCSNGQLCPPGQTCCGLSFGSQTPICFTPNSGETCCQSQLGGRTICPLSGGQRQSCCQQRSAIHCYDPNHQFCCATTTPFASVCPASNSTCCPAANNINTCF